MENKIETFVGRLGRDPELRYTKKLEPVCHLSVAVKNEKADSPIWKKVIVWGKQAENCKLYLSKGISVFVQGPNKERKFKTKEGVEKAYQEVWAQLVGFTNI